MLTRRCEEARRVQCFRQAGFVGLARRLMLICLGAAVAVGLTCVTWAVERFPPPDFTAHVMPETPQPPPPLPIWETVDVIVLLLALAAATYLALARRSRNELFILAGFSLFWFGFQREGCICSIGAIQDVAQGLFDSQYLIPWSALAFFGLPVVFALFFGRVFCAAVCPLGALQEVAAIRPQKLPDWLDHALGLFPWIYLGLAVVYAAKGTAFVICEYDPFVAFFRRSGASSMLIFGGAVLAIGIFVGRPYCRFLCPYGVLLGLSAKLARWHVRIPPQECIRCRLCEDACPYGAIVPPVPPLPRSERPRARRRLAISLAAVPLWLIAGGIGGYFLSPVLAQMDQRVRLAQWVHSGEVDPQNKFATDSVKAFRNSGETETTLFADAAERLQRFARAGSLFGVWVGLVVGLKLVQLATRPSRHEYLPDPRRCVACGRCFWYCPEEQVRRGWITEQELAQLPRQTPQPVTAAPDH